MNNCCKRTSLHAYWFLLIANHAILIIITILWMFHWTEKPAWGPYDSSNTSVVSTQQGAALTPPGSASSHFTWKHLACAIWLGDENFWRKKTDIARIYIYNNKCSYRKVHWLYLFLPELSPFTNQDQSYPQRRMISFIARQLSANNGFVLLYFVDQNWYRFLFSSEAYWYNVYSTHNTIVQQNVLISFFLLCWLEYFSSLVIGTAIINM
jgi:hypothetical protein